jgi:hypothetical protein
MDIKICRIAIHKMDEMDIKCTKSFHYKTLQNLPKLRCLVWKQTIWQPCCEGGNFKVPLCTVAKQHNARPGGVVKWSSHPPA